MAEAFLYCWTDFGLNKLYVGIRKGDPADSYICSSKLMKEEFQKRPNDFSRQIIAYGRYEDLLTLETLILRNCDARNNSDFYNMHNGDGKFYNFKHTEKTKRKITGRKPGGIPWNKGKSGYKTKPCSEERKNKISKANKGRKRPDASIYLRNISEEQEMQRRKNISETMKIKWANIKAQQIGE